MSTIHMLVGIPGSGKSTYCNKVLKIKYPEAVFVASDKVRDAHPELREVGIWPEIYRLCANAVMESKDLIFDATNITPTVRARFFEEINARGAKDYDSVAYYFDTDPKSCIERVNKRNTDPNERYLPVDIIEGYNQRLVMPTKEEGFREIVQVNNNQDLRK